jgi:hypothetical protein
MSATDVFWLFGYFTPAGCVGIVMARVASGWNPSGAK